MRMAGDQGINLPALDFAMKIKDLKMTKTILDSSKKCLEYRNHMGESLIHIAVKNRFNDMIYWLVNEGLDVDSLDCSNRTALHLAVTVKHEDMVRCLLDCNASTDSKDLYGKSPFHMAVQTGNISLITLFVKYGANVLDITLSTHQTAFHLALKNEDEKTFVLLLNNYVGDINIADVYGETLLHVLARQKSKNLAILLLKRGADLKLLNKDNETALHFAIHSRNYSIAEIFIENGANVNARNKYGESPLHLAIRYKDFRLVNLLIINNADLNERTNDRDTMLHIAINYFHEDVVNLLLKCGVNIYLRNSWDLDPFHLAIKNKCLDGAKLLLSKGVDVNSVAFGKFIGNHLKENNEEQTFTPLHTAIVQKDIDAVKLLLENGAKLDFSNNYEIFLAVESGCVEIVEQLIQRGASVNAVDVTGQSLLYTAMKIRNKEEVQTLLHFGASVKSINETGNENETALHLAVKAKDEKFVQFLLDIGIDVNICNAKDLTALFYARDGTNISNLLIANIALLKINNFFVSQRNEIIIDALEEFKSHFLVCLNELLNIKAETCCNISLMNFLVKDIFVLAKLVRHKRVVDKFKAIINAKNYPIYFKKLEENIEKAADRWELIKQVKELLCTLKYFELLYDVLDDIVENFSNEELNNFIAASNVETTM